MNITVFGSGYVGLVTSCCLADAGNRVTCVDTDQIKINNLSKGQSTIFEPGLERILQKNIKEKRLMFCHSSELDFDESEVIFIAVGTPQKKDGSADLTYVRQVSSEIGKAINNYKVIVNKSTAPVGTVELIDSIIKEEITKLNKDLQYDVVSTPEFLKEGDAVKDFMKPDRIIVGTDSEKALDILTELYKPFSRNHNKIIAMSPRSSELTKYASNAMLATKISFMNELSAIADLKKADIEEVRIGMGSDPRIGYSFIYPGLGYGGSCFPKDVRALVASSLAEGYKPRILESVDEVNSSQRKAFFKKILKEFDDNIRDLTFTFWGLSFKPNTDDVREAPSIFLYNQIKDRGAKVQAFDPIATESFINATGTKDKGDFYDSQYESLSGSDALIINTEWKQFLAPDFELILKKMNGKVIFDGRNLYTPSKMKALGFKYISIGRNQNG